MQRKVIGAQGEVTISQFNGELPGDLIAHRDKDKLGRAIISHSESGSHHVLTGSAEVLVHPNPPPGMRVLYAILDEPASLIQDAAVPHEGFHDLSGIIEFRISREFDPFSEQVRQVAD